MNPLDEVVTFLNPYSEIRRHGIKLPHWQQAGATYFLTFRLADSIPQKTADAWKAERDRWIISHPKPWSDELEQEFHQRFSNEWEKWLDESHGACVLRNAEVTSHVEEVFQFGDPMHYLLHSWVVMPNHAHALFTLGPDERLESRLKNWKGISARRINQHLGTTGSLWQKDYFDRMIRDGKHFLNVAKYIRRNPTKAHLREGEYRLYESYLVKELLD